MSNIDDLFRAHRKRSDVNLEDHDRQKIVKLNLENDEDSSDKNIDDYYQKDSIISYINEKELEIGNSHSLEDESSLKRLLLKFERAVTYNAEQRSKYHEDPIKFLPSEEALHDIVKSLSSLAIIPSLYPTFISVGSLSTLVSLIGHENSDIADSTIQVLKELTDQDIDENESDPTNVEKLAEIIVKDENILSCIVAHLQRLQIEEKEGSNNMEELVLNSLSLLDNLHEFDGLPSIFLADKKINWLAENIRECKFISPERIRQYCLELIFVLLQSAATMRSRFLLHSPQIIDTLLVILSGYISGPNKEDEIGTNCVNILQILVLLDSGREEFLAQEGVELMILFIKTMPSSSSSRWLRDGALNILVDAISSFKSEPVAKRVVNCGGLGVIFGNFSKSIKEALSIAEKHEKHAKLHFNRILVENLISVMANLLRLLSDESDEYVRVIGKLSESGFSKLTQMIQVRALVAEHLKIIDQNIKAQESELLKEMNEGDPEYIEADTEWFIRRLDGGLEILKKIDVILIWVWLDKGQYKADIEDILSQQGEGCTLNDIKTNLTKYKEELVISYPDNRTDNENKDFDEELDRLIAENVDQNEISIKQETALLQAYNVTAVSTASSHHFEKIEFQEFDAHGKYNPQKWFQPLSQE
ncbi:DUF1716-domain-containing protein [Nadsonia fulvescens var. elongata DSM 6958]|uniref:DUF1716-domain-containing protein n=1 Tax=Nadsonia fulvescens var. elongata DSM 6958 TaxID=857566 RepID=A0A1E3PT49_9ASCO|nr:DUF1716-domain-containing protein [Nadsonia fulvescens var. elongata DSM 6958]